MAPNNRYGPDFPRSLGAQFQRSLRSGEFLVAQETLKGVRTAVAQASIAANATPAIKKFADQIALYASGKGGSRSIATTNERLAKGMQTAVLQSYTERVLRQKKHPSYRIGDRYSGGALARALRAPGMFVGSYNGIAFGETNILSQEAKHWARLNYGAGAKVSQYAPASVTLTLFGTPLGVLVDDSPKRRAFIIPRGIWVGDAAEGSHDVFGSATPGFYPTSRKPYKITKGIAARRFFDAGLVYLGANMTFAYEDLMISWGKQAAADAARAVQAAKIVAKP